MIDLINNYLFLHKCVSFEAIGTIRILERSAELDFHNKVLHGPSYEVQYSPEVSDADLFLNWIVNQCQMESDKAVSMLTAFFREFNKSIQSQGLFVWNGVGTFQESTPGKLMLIPETVAGLYPDIEIERVIHKNADHTLTVGANERTKFEMEALLSGSKKSIKSRWWIAAVIMISLSVGALLFYSFNHPSLFQQQGNHQTIHVQDMPLLHEDIQ